MARHTGRGASRILFASESGGSAIWSKTSSARRTTLRRTDWNGRGWRVDTGRARPSGGRFIEIHDRRRTRRGDLDGRGRSAEKQVFVFRGHADGVVGSGVHIRERSFVRELRHCVNILRVDRRGRLLFQDDVFPLRQNLNELHIVRAKVHQRRAVDQLTCDQ